MLDILPECMQVNIDLKILLFEKCQNEHLTISHKVENFSWVLSAPWREIIKKLKEQAEQS